MISTKEIITLIILFILGIVILVTFFARKLRDIKREHYDLWRTEKNSLIFYDDTAHTFPFDQIIGITFSRRRKMLGIWEGTLIVHAKDQESTAIIFDGSSYFKRKVTVTPKRTIDYIIDELIDELRKHGISYEILK